MEQLLKSAFNRKKFIKRKTLIRVMLRVELTSLVCDNGDWATTLIVLTATLYDSFIESTIELSVNVSSRPNNSFLLENLLNTSANASFSAVFELES
jgi:hypothetical protein